jgi:hypothetical protein
MLTTHYMLNKNQNLGRPCFDVKLKVSSSYLVPLLEHFHFTTIKNPKLNKDNLLRSSVFYADVSGFLSRNPLGDFLKRSAL